MKTIKYILAIIVLVTVISLTTTDAIARHRHGHSSFSIGVGFGYPYWYGPHRGYYDYWGYDYPYYRYNYYDVIERPVIVERPPVVITQPAAPVQVYSPPAERLVDGRLKEAKPASNPAFTVWVTNDNGSRTPVILRPQGAGFVGPKNEYYATMPTEEQLKPLYGLKSNVQPADTNTTVWIDNGNGSKTPITLQKEGSNYIGPAGEKYTSLPTAEQLKALYGSGSSASQTEFNFEITKADGAKVTIVIKKEGTEFVGPKGERYPGMPTEEQLKLIYGK